MDSSLPAPEPIRFRAGKKRKAYRQRTDDDAATSMRSNPEAHPRPDSSEPPVAQNHDQSDGGDDDGDGDDDAGVAAALRMRNARKARLRGMGFTTTARPEAGSAERSLVVRDAEEQDRAAEQYGISSRFAHQTGRLTASDDKHMMEYIESRLSNRSAPPSGSESRDATPSVAHESGAGASRPETGQSVMQGRLMEIDLAEVPERKRPQPSASDETSRQGRNKKPRLGKDGKPWRSRNRRGSDDIKRDQIVEQILRESRLDVYDVPADVPAKSPGQDEDGAADERLAEEFRQQFLEDVAQRQQKKKKLAQPGRAGTEDVLKGPKLGGSRNARAAMRDLLLKKEKEGKK